MRFRRDLKSRRTDRTAAHGCAYWAAAKPWMVKRCGLSHVSNSPMPGEYMGEPHVGERRYRKYRPVRSETMDGEAHEWPGQTENGGAPDCRS
jgi:hypothetical protein